ncbi:hypothetical protein [Geminicoccus roseus]|uniref:hypothetical protein n=1 Tax=Geminicoccus roseus TaxID=404900 RepID=UPI00040DE8EC|nr:hypothetical protein [Geminicoccus roseus]
MTLPWTIAWLVASLTFAGVGIWQDRRPVGLAPAPLVPPLFWLGVGVIGIVLGSAHLLSLLTGVELHGRASF